MLARTYRQSEPAPAGNKRSEHGPPHACLSPPGGCPSPLPLPGDVCTPWGSGGHPWVAEAPTGAARTLTGRLQSLEWLHLGWDVGLFGVLVFYFYFWVGKGGVFGGPVAPVREMLTWDIVNIAAVHEPVAVLGVAERRQVGGIGCTGSDVAPNAACRRERTRSWSWGHGTSTSPRQQVSEAAGTGGVFLVPRASHAGENTSATLGWGRTEG